MDLHHFLVVAAPLVLVHLPLGELEEFVVPLVARGSMTAWYDSTPASAAPNRAAPATELARTLRTAPSRLLLRRPAQSSFLVRNSTVASDGQLFSVGTFIAIGLLVEAEVRAAECAVVALRFLPGCAALHVTNTQREPSRTHVACCRISRLDNATSQTLSASCRRMRRDQFSFGFSAASGQATDPFQAEHCLRMVSSS